VHTHGIESAPCNTGHSNMGVRAYKQGRTATATPGATANSFIPLSKMLRIPSVEV
jgi:hypothetical protein